MKNRNLPSPILCALVLSLVSNPPLPSHADIGVSTPTATVPAAQSTPAAAPTTGSARVAPVAKNTIAYTVVKGDSLTSIAGKFNTTRKKLKALNNLTVSTIKPGQILQVPGTRSAKKTAVATASKAKIHHDYLAAQPVQDFDIPASTFASCPVPMPSEDEDADSAAPGLAEKPAPIAKLVSPAELAADEVQKNAASAPSVAESAPDSTNAIRHFSMARTATGYSNIGSSSNGNSSPSPFNPPAPRLTNRGLIQSPSTNPINSTPAGDWGNRFLQTARALGDQGIEYDEDWRPPGESHAWTMDCSNTTRYIYKVTTGIQLPRTASDQYYYLHLQGKAWDVPQGVDGFADGNFLRRNLKPGDLLFWENTYRPERQPPITHVMVFLGTNDRGQWIMAGSQTSRGGEHNRRNGGPDIYIFRPSQPCGGYTTWMGLVHHQGRFCAFGRPLEADPSKLAVAADD